MAESSDASPEWTFKSILRNGAIAHIQRNGVTMMNPYHFHHSEGTAEHQAQAAVLMDQLYAADPEDHASLAAELTKADNSAGPYMLWEAFASGHSEIYKGLRAFESNAGPDGWEGKIQDYKESRVAEVMEAPGDEKSDKAVAWLEEFDGEGSDLLLAAAIANDLPLLHLLIDSGTEIHPESTPSLQPFLAACHHGSTEAAELFLNVGLDVNHIDEFGGTALMRAASGNQPDTMQFLLQRGADPHARETRTGAWNALELGAHDADVVRVLLSHNVEFSPSALAAAASHSNEAGFALLVEHADFSIPFTWEAISARTEAPTLTPLQREAVLMSLSHYNSPCPTTPSDQLTLHWLLSQLATTSSNHTYTFPPLPEISSTLTPPLNRAILANDLPTTTLLLSILTTFEPSFPNTTLLTAALANSTPILTHLLTSHSSNPNHISPLNNLTPLTAAALSNHPSTLQTLLHAGASIHLPPHAPTPLWQAIWHQHDAAARVLLAAGGPVDAVHEALRPGVARVWLSARETGDGGGEVRVLAWFDAGWVLGGEGQEEGERFLCLEFPGGFDGGVLVGREGGGVVGEEGAVGGSGGSGERGAEATSGDGFLNDGKQW